MPHPDSLPSITHQHLANHRTKVFVDWTDGLIEAIALAVEGPIGF